jgi:uncharacterized protein (DUF1697 family)
VIEKQPGSMTTYISILRGINVSGQKMIRMEALKEAYEKLGFQDVQTYLQSGNVIFRANENETGILEQRITEQVRKEFYFEVPVIVLTTTRLKEIIDINPFISNLELNPSFLHVTFLSKPSADYDPGMILAKRSAGEEIAFTGDAVYLYCPNGYGRTKLHNQFLETRLKVPTTTRNWRTTNELLKIALENGEADRI